MPNPQGPPSLRGLTYQQAQQTTLQYNTDRGYQSFLDRLSSVSIVASVGGSALQAVGNFYAVKAQEDQMKAQALSLDFAQQAAQFNSRLIQQQAARVEQSMQQQVGLSRMRGAEAQASARASAAARGVKVDSGSAREQQDAIELMSQIDAMTIESNIGNLISGLERSATDQSNQGLLAGVSARNIRASAKSLNPASAYLTTEIGNAGRVAGMFYDRFGRSGGQR
jgi:hypothetical protein